MEGRAEAGPFLIEAGGKGMLAEQEARLFNLKVQKEQQLNEEITRSRKGRMCAAPFGADVVGITEMLAMIGAVVGGMMSHHLRHQLDRVNKRVCRLNTLSFRQQKRYGIVHAPGFAYAPRLQTHYATLDDQGQGVMAYQTVPTSFWKPEMNLEQEPVDHDLSHSYFTRTFTQEAHSEAMENGRDLLNGTKPSAATIRFQKAYETAKELQNKAQGQINGHKFITRNQKEAYRRAVIELEHALCLMAESEPHTDSEPYGTLADLYTDMGDYEKAAQHYDTCISLMTLD